MFNTKSKNFSSINPAPPKKDLTFTIRFEIESLEPYTSSSIVKTGVTHTLVSTTDTAIEDLKKEIAEFSSHTYESFIASVENSPKLSDGYHAEKLKEKQSNE